MQDIAYIPFKDREVTVAYKKVQMQKNTDLGNTKQCFSYLKNYFQHPYFINRIVTMFSFTFQQCFHKRALVSSIKAHRVCYSSCGKRLSANLSQFTELGQLFPMPRAFNATICQSK